MVVLRLFLGFQGLDKFQRLGFQELSSLKAHLQKPSPSPKECFQNPEL